MNVDDRVRSVEVGKDLRQFRKRAPIPDPVTRGRQQGLFPDVLSPESNPEYVWVVFQQRVRLFAYAVNKRDLMSKIRESRRGSYRDLRSPAFGNRVIGDYDHSHANLWATDIEGEP